MAESPGQKAVLKPIMEEDVARTAVFLNRYMNDKFSSDEWERGLRAGWLDKVPHYGFMLESDGEVVGAICTLYSQQLLDGETRTVCNPHTWCVLEPYRTKSVNLILAVIRQPNLHYTMFSPNLEGEEIFSYLGFKPLPRDALILLNIPVPKLSRKVEVNFSIDESMKRLTPVDQACIEDHRGFAWLKFAFYTYRGQHGFLIYKDSIYKRLPCAQLLYVSNKSLFAECWSALRTQLLVKRGIFTTRTERRLLDDVPSFSYPTLQASAKFYMSDTLPPEVFNYTYSELVALDL